MRPHELTMRGFRSYRDEATFDFRGRHLIGIDAGLQDSELFDLLRGGIEEVVHARIAVASS